MLQQDKPEDYVVATGRTATIREFLDIAFNHIGIPSWEEYVEIDERFKRPSELRHLRGNATLAREKLNWEPKTSLEQLVAMMVDSDIQKVIKYELS